MMLCPWKTPPSSTTSVLDVMLPSMLPPRARCALPFTWIEPLKRPAMLTFWARMSASTWLCGDSATSPSALIWPFTWPSILRFPAETTLPSSLRPRADDRDLSVLCRHVCLRSLGAEAAAAARTFHVVPPPDHPVSTVACRPPIARRIASSSSRDRLCELVPWVTCFA